MSQENNPEVILENYKQMGIECSNLAAKIQELNMDKEEHRLVINTLSTLNPERKAFRLVGGVLIERKVEDILPIVEKNFEGIKQIIETLNNTLKTKDGDRRAYKEKHQIMTKEERDEVLRQKKVSA